MANTGFKGIDVRQTGGVLVFRAFLQNSSGGLVTSGTTNLYIMELQSDGSTKTYDFSTNTFSALAVTTEFQAMTYRKSNNGTTDTGLWTFVLSTLTGFTVGAVYLIRINNSGAFPTDQMQQYQYGSDEGDKVTIATGTGTADLLSAPDWSKVQNATSAVSLSGTTIGTATALTNLPAIPANWLTSAGIAAGALNGKGDWLLSSGYTAPNNTGINSIVAKLPTNNIADETLVINATNSILTAVGSPMQAGSSVTVGGYAAGQDPATLLSTSFGNIPDMVLRRHMQNVETASVGDTLTINSLYGMIQSAQKSDTTTTAGDLTVFQTNGTTQLGTLTLTTNSGASPIVGVK